MRQRGAHSRIRLGRSFGTPRASLLGGVARGLTKGPHRCLPIKTSSAWFAGACKRRANPTPPPAPNSSQTEANRGYSCALPRASRLRQACRPERCRPQEKTGCTWERWVKSLDHAKAYTWSHREIAQYVHEKYKVPGWWAQTVTVGYERIKGLRAIGQRRDGSSRPRRARRRGSAPSALRQLQQRAHPGPLATRREADGPNRHPREVDADHLADGTSVEVGFTPRGPAKSQVALTHEQVAGPGLGDEDEAILDRTAGCVGGGTQPGGPSDSGEPPRFQPPQCAA